jgi:predicted peptidase
MFSLPRTVLPLAALLGLVLASAHGGDATKTGFLAKVYKGPDGIESKYYVFVPNDYQGDKEYPVILFLHGSGSSGDDGEKQVKGGLAPAIRKMEKSFPFIVVFPQSQKKTWKAESEDGKRAVAILAEVQKFYKCDPKKVYLTGLSMGGSGTWSLAAAYPERWAAIAPICGGSDPKTAAKIKDIPCWCFHGDADPTVKVERSRDMIKALKDAGGTPRYDEYPGVGHNAWDQAYATPELYEWLLKQSSK